LKEPLDFGDAVEIGAKDGRIAALFSGRPSVGFRMVVMNNDTRAFPRQAQGDGAADALGRSGDQNRASIKRHPSIVNRPAKLC